MCHSELRAHSFTLFSCLCCFATVDYFGKCNGFPIGPLMEKGITLYGAGQCPVQRYWKDMLKMLENKQVDPSFIISHEIPFEQMEEAYKVFGTEQNDCLKVTKRHALYCSRTT